jgi:SAM-dependent methyltransferase
VRLLSTPPAGPLPLPDASVDGIVAASSVEQTPDPRAVLAEFFRVLKPGGRVRLYYESLGRYGPGQNREVAVIPCHGGQGMLLFIDRYVWSERAAYTVVTLNMALDALGERLGLAAGTDTGRDTIDMSRLEGIRARITDVTRTSLCHPSARSWMRWARQIGFQEIRATHSGGDAAERLFREHPDRPRTSEELDRLLRPVVRVVTALPAPLALDPPLSLTR